MRPTMKLFAAALLAACTVCPPLHAADASFVAAASPPTATVPVPLEVPFPTWIPPTPGACTEPPERDPSLISLCFADTTVGGMAEMYGLQGNFGVLMDNELAEKSLPCNLRLDCLTPEKGLAKVVELGGGFLTRLDKNTWYACKILMQTPPPAD